MQIMTMPAMPTSGQQPQAAPSASGYLPTTAQSSQAMGYRWPYPAYYYPAWVPMSYSNMALPQSNTPPVTTPAPVKQTPPVEQVPALPKEHEILDDDDIAPERQGKTKVDKLTTLFRKFLQANPTLVNRLPDETVDQLNQAVNDPKGFAKFIITMVTHSNVGEMMRSQLQKSKMYRFVFQKILPRFLPSEYRWVIEALGKPDPVSSSKLNDLMLG
jgi:hypothetical protein